MEYHSISAIPAFPGLQRFPDGRDFTQWTGDDSKALMKVRKPLSGSIYTFAYIHVFIGLSSCGGRFHSIKDGSMSNFIHELLLYSPKK